MAIQIRCKKCKTEMKLSSKKCTKCGSAIPKRGKIYKVIVRHLGKKISRTTTNLELAREIESKLKADIARDEFELHKKKPALTLNQVWDNFLPWAQENKKTWQTDKYNYEKHLKQIFGDMRLDTISPFNIEKFIISFKKAKKANGKKYALATIKHQLVLLTRLYSVAEKWGLYSGDNPCRKVKKPKLNNQKTEFLSDEELKRLLDTLEAWENRMSAGFILFCLYTGLRRGELFKLKWNDIDLKRQLIILRDPKGILDQTLPISDKAVQILITLPKDFKTHWIFYGKNGKQRTDFKGPWLRVKKAANLPKDFRLHGLRHHFASSLVSAGTDLYTVQKLLCHKSSAMTQRFAHLADKTLRDAVNLSDELLSKNSELEIINFKEKQNAR
ncbi:MAG: site-specific integrase [Desulfobacteraceae bacterium]|nr:site-specific integrase [Desulfobacteraceae bacterium]